MNVLIRPPGETWQTRRVITLDDCRALDADDPLLHLHDRFELPDGVLYLDGNSLGPLPRGVSRRLQQVIEDEWGAGLIRSWDTWIDLPRTTGNKVAALIGAEPDTVIVGDSTTVNLHKVVTNAVRNADGGRVVTDSGNFPTDLYVLASACRVAGATLDIVEPNAVDRALADDVAALVLTEVDFRTGRRHDLPTLTALAHQVGAVAVWDLAHSAGAFPIGVSAADVDYAVGCGYKYLNGGPGAPAYLYIAPRHLPTFENPVTGWFGHADPFAFAPEFTPAPGIDRAAIGTPPILSLAAFDAALDVFVDVDLAAVEAKSRSLTGLFIRLADEQLPEFEVVTPDRRGSQVSLRHQYAYAIVRLLVDRGVIGDFRTPDVARFGLAPLYTRHTDVWNAVAQIAAAVADEPWHDERYTGRQRVT